MEQPQVDKQEVIEAYDKRNSEIAKDAPKYIDKEVIKTAKADKEKQVKSKEIVKK